MFYLKNLSSTAIQTGILPWDFVPTYPIPDEIRRDKKKRDEWINHPSTEHYVYAFVEGLNANLRVSRSRSDGEGNPVYAVSALVADYDASATLEQVRELAKKLPFAPNWIERTLSGNWRYVWLFEKKVLMTEEFFTHFQKKFLNDFGFRVDLGMMGFDQGAWNDPCRYYTNSCEWYALRPTAIPHEVVLGWMVKASQTFKWTDKSIGASIPMEVVKLELAKRYPRFSEWPGDCQVGEQGPSFFIDGSTSPKSAIIRETGIQTFSAHATKPFYTWADLLGIAFVKEYEAVSIGRAVEGIITDGKSYYWKNTGGLWLPNDKSDLFTHLKVERRVSVKPDKDGISDAERCLSFIRDQQRVAGVAPFVMRPSGIIEVKGKRYLNILDQTCIKPSAERAVWGALGKFPWLSAYFDALFDPQAPQLAIFLAWLSIFYIAVFTCQPRQGHGLVIAGGVGVGKTLLFTKIIGALVGGHADASDFLAGTDNFNSAMFSSPFLSSDDAVSSANRQTHRLFSEIVKKLVANVAFLFKEKYIKESMTEWYGRVGISCNDDEESVRKIPDLDISILDKLIILRASRLAKIEFPPSDQLEAILKKELPHFARYLLDFVIPEELIGKSRYIIKHYCEPTLFATAQQSSTTAGFAEILEDFVSDYFKVKNLKDTVWEGTSFQLHKAILTDPTADAAMKPFSVDSVGRHLSMLKNKGAHIEVIETRTGSSRRWRIYPDAFHQLNKQ